MPTTYVLAMVEIDEDKNLSAVYALKDPVDTENIIIDCKETLEHLDDIGKYYPGKFMRGNLLDRIDLYFNGPS